MRTKRHPWPEPLSSQAEIEGVCMRNLLATSNERVFFKDVQSRFVLVSAGWLEGVGQGHSLETVIGKTDFDFFSQPHAMAAIHDEQRIVRTGEAMVAKIERETFHDRPDAWVSTTKMPLRNEDGEIIGTFGITRDISEQREAQQALVHQALHDSVTGLANRVALMDRLGRALVKLERQPGQLALLFIDLDDFKSINDTLGHDVGDRVLVEVGHRLTRVTRRFDTLARLGGDELVLLCTALRDDDDIHGISEQVARTISAPLHAGGLDMIVTASLGAVVTSDPTADPGELLQRADIAMYAAKRAGRDRLQVYNAGLRRRVEANRGLAADLRRAIDRSELFVLYQPVWHLDTGELRGVEALVRWQHPERGRLAPSEFIRVAEQRGLIAAIDEFVLAEACRQLAAWTSADRGLEDLTMAVNLSGGEFRESALVTRVASALELHHITASQLCLEITETALIGELGETHRTVASLSALGVRIALDDFGTGYSTFALLQLLPADILKIDRDFVAQIARQSRGRKILAGMIDMAHALGMTVIAEGIETQAQRRELTALHCDQGQGNLFAAALHPDEIPPLRAATRLLPHRAATPDYPFVSLSPSTACSAGASGSSPLLT